MSEELSRNQFSIGKDCAGVGEVVGHISQKHQDVVAASIPHRALFEASSAGYLLYTPNLCVQIRCFT